MICEERSGFLFAHNCEKPGVGNCGTCSKSVCEDHMKQVDANVTCVSCMKQQMSGNPGLTQQYRDRYSYDPYYYGYYHYPHYHYYDYDDYRSFDRHRSSTTGSGDPGDPDASWS